MPAPAPLRILIVGGGIGGLALARALAADGYGVEVIEIAPAWKPLGAGIVLASNAWAVLRALGLGPAARAVGRPLPWMDIRDHRDRLLAHSDLSSLPGELGAAFVFHRAELHDVLLAGASGARITLGASIDAIEDRGHEAVVDLSDGRRAAFDLVVGADGVRSRTRQLLLGDAAPAVRYAGYACWRYIAPVDAGLVGAVEMWGPGRRVGVVPLSQGRVYVFLTENGPAAGADPESGRHAWVAAKFSDFAGPARPVLASLRAGDSTALLRHDIEDLERPVLVPRPGRVALIGDAAHATTPNLGQGASQALEDVAALTLALRAHPGREGLPAALEHYVELRAARVRAIVTLSRRLGALAQWSTPLGRALAAWTIRLAPAALLRASVVRLLRPGIALAKRLEQKH